MVLTTGVLRHWGERLGWRFDVITRMEWAGLLTGHPHVDTVIGLRGEDLKASALPGVFRRLRDMYAGCGLIDLHDTLRSRLLAGMWRGPVLRYPKFSVARRLFLLSGGKFGGRALRDFSVTQRYALAAAGIVHIASSGSATTHDCPYVPTDIAAAFPPQETGRSWGGFLPPPREKLLPCITLQEEERVTAVARLTGLFGSGIRPVALHPYAAHPYKTWPAGHWRDLAWRLDANNIPWIALGKGTPLFPGRKEDLVNSTTLRETCALLAASRVLVSGDSGPVHLAGAVCTPVIALFGPTTREWGFYPAGPFDRVLERELPCRPCSLHGSRPCPDKGRCLTGILPEEVLGLLPRHETEEGAGGTPPCGTP